MRVPGTRSEDAPLETELLPSGGFRRGYLRFRLWMSLAIVGIALIVAGLNEVRLWSASAQTAQRITCRQLAEEGPGANAHVVLTNFLPGRNICWHKARQGDTEWTAVLVPLVPSDGPVVPVSLFKTTAGGMKANASGIQVLLKSTSRHNQMELLPLYSTDAIKGTVVNCIDGVSSREMELLRSAYPGTDFSQCWILEEGRRPSSPMKCLGFIVGGAVVLLVPIGVACGRKRSGVV